MKDDGRRRFGMDGALIVVLVLALMLAALIVLGAGLFFVRQVANVDVAMEAARVAEARQRDRIAREMSKEAEARAAADAEGESPERAPVDAEAAAGAAGTDSLQQHVIAVVVNQDGVAVNGQAVPLEVLTKGLRELDEADQAPSSIQVTIEPGCPEALETTVLTLCRAAGASEVQVLKTPQAESRGE